MQSAALKNEVEAILTNDKRVWKMKFPATVTSERKIIEKIENITEEIAMRFYSKPTAYSFKPAEILLNAGSELYPVKDKRDFVEFEDMVTRDFVYKSVPFEEYKSWAKPNLERYFSVLLQGMPAVKYPIILIDDWNDKVVFSEHEDGSYSYISWLLVD